MNTTSVKPSSVKTAPSVPYPAFDNIPSALLSMQRWVLWKMVYKAELNKWTKVPYSPETHAPYNRHPSECGNLDMARKVLLTHGKAKGFAGVGLSAMLEDGLTYLDFDRCLDDNGVINSPRLEKFVRDLGSYTEISPSGRGLRVIVKTPSSLGKINKTHKATERGTPSDCSHFEAEGVEIWNDGKYATITGQRFLPELNEVKANDEVMGEFLEVFYKAEPTKTAPPPKTSSTSPAKDRIWTREEVRSMLSHLDPAMPRLDWFKIGKALWDWSKAEGVQEWEMWSRGATTSFVEGECAKVSGHSSWHNGEVSVGYLVEQAKARGWVVPQREDLNPFKTGGDKTEAEIHLFEMPDKFSASDAGNAERLAQSRGAERIRYVVDVGEWMQFDGTRWVDDVKGVAGMSVAKQSIREAKEKFRKLLTDKDSKERREAEQFCIRSEHAHSMRSAVDVARTIKSLQVSSLDLLDKSPDLLNTPDFVVNLRTGAKEAHRPDLMMSKQTKLSPDFDADCPKWKETIKNATMGDEKLQDLLELTLGMSVTGYTHEIFFIFYGQSTDNLKSTICETVLELLGEYGGTITSPALTANKASGEGATPAIAGMRGKRLILADEWKENAKLDDAIVKRICSQDAITARMLHSNPITFTPTHTIILRTNSLPIVSGSDEGVWKRLRPLPFNYKVPPEKKDEGYRTRMVKEEGGAILAWLCRCAMRFIKMHESGEQLPNPDSVVALKKQYRTDSDILSQWGDAELEFGSFPPYFVSNKDLKDSFTGFAEDRDEEAKNTSHKAFAMFLGKHGCNPKKIKGERGWSGVRLRIHQEETDRGDGVETPF